MSLTELAAEYRRSAELLRLRIGELERRHPADKRERTLLAERIDCLRELYVETIFMARQMEDYYVE